jgi:CBS-domain-containing membrane protein
MADKKARDIMSDDCTCIGENDSIDHKVRRLPVIDDRKLVGIISQADIATNIDEEKDGDLVEAISAAP